MARRPGTLDTTRRALLDRIVRRMDRDGHATDEVRQAVDALTAAADPNRAARLAVGPGEPPVLVERLTVWALRRTTDQAVAHATRMLEATAVGEMEAQFTDQPVAHASPART